MSHPEDPVFTDGETRASVSSILSAIKAVPGLVGDVYLIEYPLNLNLTIVIDMDNSTEVFQAIRKALWLALPMYVTASLLGGKVHT